MTPSHLHNTRLFEKATFTLGSAFAIPVALYLIGDAVGSMFHTIATFICVALLTVGYFMLSRVIKKSNNNLQLRAIRTRRSLRVALLLQVIGYSIFIWTLNAPLHNGAFEGTGSATLGSIVEETNLMRHMYQFAIATTLVSISALYPLYRVIVDAWAIGRGKL